MNKILFIWSMHKFAESCRLHRLYTCSFVRVMKGRKSVEVKCYSIKIMFKCVAVMLPIKTWYFIFLSPHLHTSQNVQKHTLTCVCECMYHINVTHNKPKCMVWIPSVEYNVHCAHIFAQSKAFQLSF